MSLKNTLNKLFKHRNYLNSKDPKKILFVEQNTDGTFGGSHYCLLELVKGLNKNKFIPYILFYQKNSMTRDFEATGCKLIVFQRSIGLILKNRFPILQKISQKQLSNLLIYQPLLLFQRSYNFIVDFLIPIFKFMDILKKHKIDLVHLNNAPTKGYDWVLATKLIGIKCITHNRGKGKLSKMRKFLVRGFDAVISISNVTQDYLCQQGIELTNKFVIINDGIDIDAVISARRKTKISVKSEFKVTDRQPLIGIIGNIKKWKGQEVVIKAVKLLKTKYRDIRCLIIGDVSNLEADKHYFEHLKQLVKSDNLLENIIFTGSRRNVSDLISAFDLLLHSSITPEPFGRVVLEGMVLEKPVIATNIGGPTEIIEDGISGFLIPPNDPQVLAQKIDHLLKYPDIGKKIGIAARKRVEEKFHIKLNVSKTEQLYNSLLYQS